ncbi:MAG: serine/threonine protein kinase [Planctomycetia bacterium]|nr:serine/threonine protein kinase [Planctomycetia bacterium]
MDPERIGPYQILEKIGSGGMGNVYLGREAESGRLAAVKVLTASLAREPGFVERFNREIDAMRKLKNPHIVSLYESGVEGENYYYAMEYVAGETLMAVLRREKRLPWRKAFAIAIDVCLALKAAHDAGIIHRDLKPSNLLVTPEGLVKLTDFGVAQVFASGRLTATGGIIGTAEYMSPEQAQGKRAGKQSDLYSLGAVLYAMITGRTPFSGSTAVEVIQKHKFGVFDRPRLFVTDLPQRVDDTICKLLEKEPENRFPDALVLLRHLEQTISLEDYAAAGVTLASSVEGKGSRTTVPATEGALPQAPRHPGPATLMQTLMRAELSEVVQGGFFSALFNNIYVLVTLLILVILGGVWFFRPQQPTPQEMFDRASAALQEEPGPEWLRARREYLEPLLALDSNTWGDRVRPLLRKIDAYEATRPGRASRPRSEAERQLQLALYYRQVGDLARAEKILAALSALLAGDEQLAKLQTAVTESLDEVRRQRAGNEDRDRMLKAALERAATLARDGSPAEAQEIWKGIIELYGDDASAREFVRQAQHELDSLNPHHEPQ